MTADLAIDHDLACIFCGYNLRSLAAEANCPECGNAVAPSLANFRNNRSKIIIGSCNPAIVSEWIEGLLCVLGSFALITLMMWILSPVESPRLSFSRRFGLYAACTGWVLNGLGIWKVAANDPFGDPPPSRQRIALRWCIVFYTALPAMLFLHVWIPITAFVFIFTMLSLAFGIAGVVAGASFHSRLAHLAAISGSGRLAGGLQLFAVVSPVGTVILYCLLAAAEPANSLDTLLLLPVPSYQSMIVFGVLPALAQNPFNGDSLGLLVFLLALLFVGSELSLVVLLFRHLQRARRQIPSL